MGHGIYGCHVDDAVVAKFHEVRHMVDKELFHVVHVFATQRAAAGVAVPLDKVE